MNDRNDDYTPNTNHGPQIVALFVFVVALWAQVGDAYVGRFIEDGLNLVVAKSLARGEGLTLIHFPVDVPALWVPPLYPFVVSLVGRLWPNFPDNLVLIQILDSALLGAAAWIVSLHVRRLHLSRVFGYGAVVLGFSSVAVLSLAVSAFPEPLFLVFAAGAVLLADREHQTRPSAIAAGLLAGASALTGTLGPFVIVGVVASIFWRKRYFSADLAGGAALLVALPWFLWSWFANDPSGLAADAVANARLAAELNGTVSWQGLGPLVNLLLDAVPQWLVVVLGPVAAGLFGVGLLTMIGPAPALTLVMSACVIGAWLYPPAVARNEWILFPWFVVLMTIGSVRAWGYNRQSRIPVGLAVLALLLAYVPKTTFGVVGREFAVSLVDQNDFLRLLVMSINSELPEDAVIASDAPSMIHLYTGRLVVPARRPAVDNGDVVGAFCAANVTHIARTNLTVPSAIDDEFVAGLRPTIANVFDLTDGPALYQFSCPR